MEKHNLVNDPDYAEVLRFPLPGMLREAGYRTVIIGKWHLGLGDPKPQWNEISDRVRPMSDLETARRVVIDVKN